MKKLITTLVAVLIVFVGVSCNQYVYVPVDPNDPIFGGGSTTATTVTDVADNVDTGTILKDAITADETDDTIEIVSVTKLPDTSGSTTVRAFSNMRATTAYEVVIRLNGYRGTANGTISGTISYRLEVSAGSAYTYTVSSSSVTVTASEADRSVTATVSGFTGSVSGITVVTGSITVTTGATVEVEQNKYAGSYEAGNETITEAGENSEGEGTEANPYVIMTADDLANIDRYGNDVYLELGADIEGRADITTTDVTLDLNGHTIKTPELKNEQGQIYGADSSSLIVEGGSLTILDSRNGAGIDAGYAALWARKDGEIHVINGTYRGTGSKASAVLIGNYGGSAESIENGSVIIDDGIFYGPEGCIALWGASELNINGGEYTSDGNLVIMTNGSADLVSHPFTITFNDGVINGSMIDNFRASNYIAGGFYIANQGNFYLNGGTINIEGGVGVAVRGGNVVISDDVIFNMTPYQDDTEGLLGDSPQIVVSDKQIVVDPDSRYPGRPITVTNYSAYVPVDAQGEACVPGSDGVIRYPND